MKSLVWIVVPLVFVACIASPSQGQTPEFTVAVNENFALDVAERYRATGDVKWSAGKVEFQKGGGLAREFDLGSRLEFEIDFDLTEATVANSLAEFSIDLQGLRGGVATRVTWQQDAQREPPSAQCELQILDVSRLPNGRLSVRKRRAFPLTSATLAENQWRVSLKFGVLEIFSGKTRVGMTQAPYSEGDLNGVTFHQTEGSSVLRRFVLRGTPPMPKLTPEAAKVRGEALNRYAEAQSRVYDELRARHMQDAVKSADLALAAGREIEGNEGQFVLDAEALRAMCLEFDQQVELALPIRQRLVKDWTGRVGNVHVKTAEALEALGNCERLLGETSAAREHFLQALVINRMLLGEATVETAKVHIGVAQLVSESRPAEAQQHFIAAVEALEHPFDPSTRPLARGWIPIALSGLSMIYQRCGDFDALKANRQRELEIENESDSPNVARIEDLRAKLATIPSLLPDDDISPQTRIPLKSDSALRKPLDEPDSELLLLKNADLAALPFETNPRDELVISGKSKWTAGRMRLSQGARASLGLRPTQIAELNFDLRRITTDGPAKHWSCRMGFCASLGDVAIRLVYPADAPGKVQFLSQQPRGDVVREILIRTWAAPSSPDGRWTIRDNHGHVIVEHDGVLIGEGTSVSDVSVDAMYIAPTAGEVEVSGWSYRRLDSKRPKLSPTDPELDVAALQKLLQDSQRLMDIPTAEEGLAATRKLHSAFRIFFGEHANGTLEIMARQAEYYRLMGRFLEALELRRQHVQLNREYLGDGHPDTARARIQLADVCNLIGRSAEAWEVTQSSLPVFQKVFEEDDDELSRAYASAANTLTTLGHGELALALAERSRQGYVRRHGENSSKLIVPLGLLANMHRARSEFAAAERYWTRAYEISSDHNGLFSLETIGLAVTLSQSEVAQGNVRAARRRLEPLLPQLRQKSPAAFANVSRILADFVSGQLDGERAVRLCVDALEALGTDTSRLDLWSLTTKASVHGTLSGLYEKQRRFPEAEAELAAQREILLRLYGSAHPQVAQADGERARLLIESGQLDKARQILEELLPRQIAALGEAHGDTATTLQLLAVVLAKLGDHTAADRNFQRSIAAFQQYGGPADISAVLTQRLYGHSLIENRQVPEGLEQIQDSTAKLEVRLGARHPETITGLQYLAHAHTLQGEWEQSYQLQSQALDRQIVRFGEILPSLPLSQALLQVRKLREECLQMMKMALVVEVQGRKVLSAKLKTVPRIDVAQVYRAWWQTRSIASRSTQRPRAATDNRPARELREVRAQIAHAVLNAPAKQAAAEYQVRLRELTERKERLQQELAASGESDSEVPVDFTDLGRRLPKGLAVVDFVHLQRGKIEKDKPQSAFDDAPGYAAFILRHSENEPGYTLAWVPLPDGAALDAAIADLRKAINATVTTGRVTSWSAELAQVARQAWQPLRERLGGCTHVIVIPDGELAFVPWGALPGAAPGKVLLDDLAITTAADGLMVAQLLSKPVRKADATCLLVGNVNYESGAKPASKTARGTQVWEPLPATKTEIANVRQVWGQRGAVQSLTGDTATKRSVLDDLTKSRYVHFATHGFFVNPKFRSIFSESDLPLESDTLPPLFRHPLALSGIVLAGANGVQPDDSGALAGGDALLTAEEINDLDLSGVELVVLSACETGLGQVAGGEGVFSLQRGFHLAGAGSVIASLWMVDDRATDKLMSEFYRNLWEKKLSKLDALRQAQLRIRRDFDPQNGVLRGVGGIRPTPDKGNAIPPLYWAAFSLSGDWR